MPQTFNRPVCSWLQAPMYWGNDIGTPATATQRGHSPIAIAVSTIAGRSYDPGWVGAIVHPGPVQHIGLLINGTPASPVLTLTPDGAAAVADIEPAIVIPKVTLANVDGAGTWGFGPVAVGQFTDQHMTIAYTPVNAADVGKQIMGIGSPTFIDTSAGLFACFKNNFENDWWGGWSGFGGSDVFNSLFELEEVYGAAAATYGYTAGARRVDGDVSAVSSVPWTHDGTFQDLMIVTHAAPAFNYQVALRINGATVRTIDVTAGSDRIFLASDTTPVAIGVGDRPNFMCTADGGGTLAAELLWTFRAGDSTDPGWMSDEAGGAFAGGYSG